MKIKALIAIFMATLTVLEAHQCYLKRFKNVTNGKFYNSCFQLAKIFINLPRTLTAQFTLRC